MALRDAVQAAGRWLRRKGGQLMASVGETVTDDRPTWPPAEAHERLRSYHRFEECYEGHHEEVFVKSNEFKYSYDDSREYVVVNYLGSLTDLLTSRLLGDGVSIKAPQTTPGTQEFFDHLYHKCELEQRNYKAGLELSYFGETVYKVRYDAAALRLVIETVRPDVWFPDYDPLDADRLTASTIGTLLWGPRETRYLWQERHEMRDGASWVTNRLFRLEDEDGAGCYRYDPAKSEVGLETLQETEGLLPEVPTGIDEMLLVHVNQRESDYADLLAIQAEFNNRLTQRAEILDKHADPAMWGPDLRNEYGNMVPGSAKYLPTIDGWTGGAPAGYITWDGQLAAVENELRELREDFATTAGIDLQAMRPGEAGGPVSGRALRLGQMKTQDRVKAKQKVFGTGLQHVLSICTKLANAPTVSLDFRPSAGGIEVLEPEDIVIEFATGLPTLRIEEIEEQQLMLDAGIQSRVRAVMELHGVNRQDAEEILAEIDGEVQAAAPTTGTASLRTPLFETVQPGSLGGG